MSKPIVLITGATGQQGGATIRALQRRGYGRIRALVRNPQAPKAVALARSGVALAQGDLDDERSLHAALTDVSGVLSVQSPMKIGPAGEERQGKRLARLAAEHGVRHFVQCSAGGVERESGVPHFESKRAIERHIADLGLPATILRPAAFMENFSGAVFRLTMLSMMKTFLRPDQTMQLVSVQDVGWFAAEAFERRDRYIGQSIELAGDSVTPGSAASVLRASGARPSRGFTLPGMMLARLPEDFRLMFAWIARDGFRADIQALRRTYPGLLTLAEWAQQNARGAGRGS
ncbi:NmrA/HSCARG family protein [Swaminathania salitolerans]|uniref:NmrA family transcriptional regulator n=1 Tax=Swaminathania salitolerans TaxID=182838 RepID=A0A511BN21_9PROT|nr:NmrA/HSCARG family protein [Swaminathania salitolerans]GBQ16379.1 putative nucleoside-diphosphate-sugar epimerase [Swaminathania salitolerans LMG 21291]GEL01054.1 NmrA family transcriptional regulator [Swaminathania salitolerans]